MNPVGMIADASNLPADEVLTFTRRFRAFLAELWDHWTTSHGNTCRSRLPCLAVKVHGIDQRARGMQLHSMSAKAPCLVV